MHCMNKNISRYQVRKKIYCSNIQPMMMVLWKMRKVLGERRVICRPFLLLCFHPPPSPPLPGCVTYMNCGTHHYYMRKTQLGGETEGLACMWHSVGRWGKEGDYISTARIDYVDLKEMKGEFGLERRMSCCHILFQLILYSILLTLKARNCIWFIGLRWYFIFLVFRWRNEGFDYLLVM